MTDDDRYGDTPVVPTTVPIGKLIDGFLSEHGMDAKLREQRGLAILWTHMRDKNMRDHVVSLDVNRGKSRNTLVLYVDASVWTFEFKMRAGEIISEFNIIAHDAGQDLIIHDLQVKLSRSAREEGQGGALRGGGAHVDYAPLSASDEEEIRRSLEGITDPVTRQHALEAMTIHFQWKMSNRSD